MADGVEHQLLLTGKICDGAAEGGRVHLNSVLPDNRCLVELLDHAEEVLMEVTVCTCEEGYTCQRCGVLDLISPVLEEFAS